ncbi:MAG: c-type cytochrome [Candidatus Sulfotelmatobacter sp.]
MGKFILGAITCLTILVAATFGLAMLGFLPTQANVAPPRLEGRVANQALDASMERHAPRVTNPLTASDQNLIDGMKIYYVNCSLCHGGLDRKPAALAKNFYPPVPNLISDPPEDPEWHIFFTIRTGVRYTGMPAWDGVLTEQDTWKVTSFLSHMDKLPPGVQQYWQDTFNVAPAAGGEGKDHAEKESR